MHMSHTHTSHTCIHTTYTSHTPHICIHHMYHMYTHITYTHHIQNPHTCAHPAYTCTTHTTHTHTTHIHTAHTHIYTYHILTYKPHTLTAHRSLILTVPPWQPQMPPAAPRLSARGLSGAPSLLTSSLCILGQSFLLSPVTAQPHSLCLGVFPSLPPLSFPLSGLQRTEHFHPP